MKTEAYLGDENWLNVTIVAETPQESSKLLQLGMARNAAASKVSYFYASSNGIACHITLMPVRQNDGQFFKPTEITKQQ